MLKVETPAPYHQTMPLNERDVPKGQAFLMHRRFDWAHFLIEGSSLSAAFSLRSRWTLGGVNVRRNEAKRHTFEH